MSLKNKPQPKNNSNSTVFKPRIIVKKETSQIRKLKKEGRINDETIDYLSLLSLEEILTLKLELQAKALRGKIYAFPLYTTLPRIMADALLRFALDHTTSLKEAAMCIGMTERDFCHSCEKNLLYTDMEENE